MSEFSIKDIIPNMSDTKFYQKKMKISTLKYPEKYTGKSDFCVIRSSWELMMVKLFDSHENILEWTSEEIVIPYISPIDKIKHNYYPDFYCKTLNKRNKIREWILEIKPYKETIKPKIKDTYKTSTKIESVKRFIINQAKWTYAKDFCKRHNMKFQVLTEFSLGIK